MPTNEEFEQAEENTDRWLRGRLEGQSYMARLLCPLIEQICRDLNEAHNEILRQQGVVESEYYRFDWPEWSNQANSIRWAEDILKKKLAKTNNWTRYPSA